MSSRIYFWVFCSVVGGLLLTACGGGSDKTDVATTASAADVERLLNRNITARVTDCPRNAPSTLSCGIATVPLDWTKAAGETIEIWYATQAASGIAKETLIPFAGGPGDSLSNVLDEGLALLEALPEHVGLFVDVRGTGLSSLLRCPALERLQVQPSRAADTDVTQCAQQIGSRRDYFNTVSSVLDIEAIRRQLKLPAPSLFGVSYGTWMATAYSVLLPTTVRAAVLDGPFPLLADVFGVDRARAREIALARLCETNKQCDAAAVSKQIEAISAELRVRPRALSTLNGPLTEGLFGAALLVPLQAGALAFVDTLASAAAGNYAPLLAAIDGAGAIVSGGPAAQSPAVTIAVTCNDYPMPFSWDVDQTERRRQYDAAVAKLAPGSFGWTSVSQWVTHAAGDVSCVAWPSPATPAALRMPTNGPFPSLPVLLGVGEVDVQTPVSGAKIAAAQFPNAVLVEVPKAPHVLLRASPCWAQTAVEFIATKKLPAAAACALGVSMNPRDNLHR